MMFRRSGLAVLLLPFAVQAQSTTPCTGLCQQQVQCPNGGTTTISGTVYAPNGVDPVPNVTVYIPNAPVNALPAGISCPAPGTLPSGSPLVGAFTNFDGTFSLPNVPVGTNIPLVIIAGKWRSQFTIPVTTACANTVANNIRFARNQTEGDIPKFAVVTGSADQVECVLRKVGIDDSEFTNLGGSGRIQLVQAAGAPGALVDSSTRTQAAVMGDSTTLNGFDVLMLPCEGGAYNEPAAQLTNLVSYADGGGRVYGSHFAYEWMYRNPPFNTVAQWKGSTTNLSDGPATVNQSFGSGATLAKWLQFVGASTTLGQIPVQVTRSDINAVNPPTQTWLTLNAGTGANNNNPMQFTWDAPVGATNQQCGRVLFNEYHVENPPSTPRGLKFPAECASTAGPMTAQEKLLEYSLFDLSNNGGPATMTPASADFGNQAVGYTTASQNFTITNNSVFASGISGAPTTTGDFLITGNTCGSVKSGSSCTISVAFKPTAVGPRTGALAVTFAGTSLSATLTGNGVPAFSVTPTALNFGSFDVGATSPAQAVQITNLAPGPLDFPAFFVSGDFKATTNCPNSIPVGGSCQLLLTFTPTATGTLAGTVTANGLNGSIGLTGNGVDFALKFGNTANTVYAGLSDTANLTASPIAGFKAPVTLNCATTAPAASAPVVNGSFTLSSDVTTKVTVTTVAKYTLAGYGNPTLWTGLVGIVAGAGMFTARRRYPALTRAGLACLGLWLGSTVMSGCSGKLPAQNASYTPVGAYTVTITGTDGFLTHTASYQLTVKDK